MNEILWTLIVILLVLWFFGYVGPFAIGSLIHLILLLVVVLLFVQLVSYMRRGGPPPGGDVL